MGLCPWREISLWSLDETQDYNLLRATSITSLPKLSCPQPEHHQLACATCSPPALLLSLYRSKQIPKTKLPTHRDVHVSKRGLSDHGRWFAFPLLSCKWVRTSLASLPGSCWRRKAGSGPSAIPRCSKALSLLFSWLTLSLSLGRGGLG